MKRGTPGKIKFPRLCRRMRWQRWQAVGILESLWELTAKSADDGGIGRLSNEEIALELDYLDDENTLISALVETGWLDPHPVHRLVVHDWSEHADKYIHQRLKRQNRRFADGFGPFERTTARDTKVPFCDTKVPFCDTTDDLDEDRQDRYRVTTTRHKTAICDTKAPFWTQNAAQNEVPHARAVPVPVPVRETQTLPLPPPSDLTDLARSIWANHPKHRRPPVQAVERALAVICMDAPDPQATAEGIHDRHAGWVVSDEWTREGQRYAKDLLKWLDPQNGGWMTDPPEVIAQSPPGQRRGGVTAAEVARTLADWRPGDVA